MRFILRTEKIWMTALSFALIANVSVVRANEVSDVRIWAAPDSTRIVFDIAEPVIYRVLSLEKPDRVVVDMQKITLKSKRLPLLRPDSSIRGVRYAVRDKSDLRIVIDVEKLPAQIKHFKLTPNEEYGNRVVVELVNETEQQITIPEVARVIPPAETTAKRDIVIAVDAGHGGEDPGARGRRGTNEKDVVLSVARKLATIINNEPGMKAVLVREGDYYISLRKRIAIARKHKADFFVSVHADAYNNPRVSGSSVFILSSRGASSEAARWLAAKENSADLVGGVSLDDKDDVLASVLLDLSLSGSIEVSNQVARQVLDQIKQVGPLHKDSVQQAGFVVLKSPDIPSILVETAFISNPQEERRLVDADYQQQLAQAIYAGVRRYFAQNPPPGTQLASNSITHIVKKGESLEQVAEQYRLNSNQLTALNDLANESVDPGQVLRIPIVK